MDLQVISRDGEPEYAVLPWAQYQALLKAAGLAGKPSSEPAASTSGTTASELPASMNCVPCARPKALKRRAWRVPSASARPTELIENGTREPDGAIKRSLAWELGVSGWRGES